MAQRIFAVSKILSVTDVDDKVALPAEIRKHMQPMMNEEKIMELEAIDRWNQRWPLKYCSYALQNGKFKNPVLSGAGWRKIVNENGVRHGDELIFSGDQVEGADGVQYMIQVIRQIVPLYGEPDTVEVVKLKSQTRMTFQGQPM
ncbi:hypothetical protein EZV62_006401 [Acer yangbiense]|uniref:TF-B3 domain-containing protein n=1 Tax=Acer yangbiense TaxID=1000413 RepID=A0A5C7I9S1_9ROSI|nr:hypothetical protein EZV62_006401 [Acer yangbiense]